MRLAVVGDLIAHTGSHSRFSSIRKFCEKFPFEAQQNVTLLAPVIGQIVGRVLDEPYPDIAEVPRSPKGGASFSGVRRRFDLLPIDYRERKPADVHGLDNRSYV